MAVPIPVRQTMVDADVWGKPITDEVNRISPLVVAPTAWVNMTLSSPWVNLGGSRSLSNYRKRGDVIDLNIHVSGGTSGTVLAILPAGFLPVSIREFMGRGGPGVVIFNLTTVGQLIAYLQAGADNTLVSVSASVCL